MRRSCSNYSMNILAMPQQQKIAGNTSKSFFESTNNTLLNNLAHIKNTNILKSSLPQNFAAKYQGYAFNQRSNATISKYLQIPVPSKKIYYTQFPVRFSQSSQLIRPNSIKKVRKIPEGLRQTQQVIYEGNKKTETYKIVPQRILRPDQLIPFYLIHKNEPRVTVSFFR